MSLILQLMAQRFSAPNTDVAAGAEGTTRSVNVATNGGCANSNGVRAFPGRTPLVLDSPHSGVHYPEDFRFSCPLAVLRHAEDTHVDKLWDFSPALGAAWVEALFPRSYLDVNRNTTEVDATMLAGPWPEPLERDGSAVAKIRLGKGLVWKCTDDGTALYDRLLDVDEVQARITRHWHPYHAAVARAVRQAHAKFGYCIHLNCHSMPSVASAFSTDFPGLRHPDFVVGDRDGSSADRRLSLAICDHLRAKGYTVDYNHPYKGVELVRRHGDPKHHRHSIQLEINRKLYMDEDSLALNEGFGPLRADLRSLLEFLRVIDPRTMLPPT